MSENKTITTGLDSNNGTGWLDINLPDSYHWTMRRYPSQTQIVVFEPTSADVLALIDGTYKHLSLADLTTAVTRLTGRLAELQQAAEDAGERCNVVVVTGTLPGAATEFRETSRGACGNTRPCPNHDTCMEQGSDGFACLTPLPCAEHAPVAEGVADA